jgi:multiple sugar transport system substrate-binding protein
LLNRLWVKRRVRTEADCQTQLRPIEEAQKMRKVILKDFPREVDYVTEQAPQLPVRIKAEQQGGTHTIDIIGALHGALPYVPDGADINALSYDQLAAWASAVREKTGKRLLGFPAGPQGLMHRFFEGFLYPSYTGGVVVPFRSEAAETMWTHFASLWKSVNPNSASYNFMQEPLLSGDVWIAFDHIARVLDALRQKPDEFVAFPGPAGPKGRGYMPALAGLAVVKGAPDVNGAMALIDYLEQPETQIATTRSLGFFPVAKVDLPPDLEPGLKLGANAIAKMQSAKDALPAVPPIGLGQRDGEFYDLIAP